MSTFDQAAQEVRNPWLIRDFAVTETRDEILAPLDELRALLEKETLARRAYKAARTAYIKAIVDSIED